MTTWWNEERQRWRYEFQYKRQRYANVCRDENGDPVTSKRAAEEVERQVRAAAKRGVPPSAPIATGGFTLMEAMALLEARARPGRNSATNQKTYGRELLSWFGPDAPVAEVEMRVWDYVAWSRKQKVRVWIGGGRKAERSKRRNVWKETDRLRSDSTINRYLDCLRKACRLAHEGRDPVTQKRLVPEMPQIPGLAEPDALPRPVHDEDVVAVIAAAPLYLADAIALCVLMGFRKSEVFRLTVGHVARDFSGVWLHGKETKGSRGEFMLAEGPAPALLRRLVEQARARGVDHLITWRRETKAGRPEAAWRPLKDPRKSWRSALKAAGVPAHRFHDLKGTFTTELVKRVPSKVAQTLSRHKSPETTDRYIRLVDETTRSAVAQLANTAFGRLDFSQQAGRAAGESPTQKPHPGEGKHGPQSAKSLESLVGATGFEPATPRPPDSGAERKVLRFQRPKDAGKG